jgi:hypothetical protein
LIKRFKSRRNKISLAYQFDGKVDSDYVLRNINYGAWGRVMLFPTITMIILSVFSFFSSVKTYDVYPLFLVVFLFFSFLTCLLRTGLFIDKENRELKRNPKHVHAKI